MIVSNDEAGCGKTSVIGLLERFYDPQSGSINYDGVDISTLDIIEYRKAISLVSQEPTLYQGLCLVKTSLSGVHLLTYQTGSIRDNVLFGVESSTISDAQINEACKNAEIADFINSLPEGIYHFINHPPPNILSSANDSTRLLHPVRPSRCLPLWRSKAAPLHSSGSSPQPPCAPPRRSDILFGLPVRKVGAGELRTGGQGTDDDSGSASVGYGTECRRDLCVWGWGEDCGKGDAQWTVGKEGCLLADGRPIFSPPYVCVAYAQGLLMFVMFGFSVKRKRSIDDIERDSQSLLFRIFWSLLILY